MLRFFLLLLVAFCTACSPVDRLERATAHDAGDFYADLAAEYLAVAQSENALGNNMTRDHFAGKGLHAAKHRPTPPENPESWNIEDRDAPELHDSYMRMLYIRSAFLERVASQSLARTQLLYDCWVVQTAQPENERTAPCRQAALQEIAQLESIRDNLNLSRKASLPASFTLLFDINDSAIDRDDAYTCLLYTSPSPRDRTRSRMPSSA